MPPLAATLFATIAAMTAIVALRYLAVSGAFAWIGVRRFPHLHDGLQPQIRREIGWSLASAAIYAAPAGAAVWAWQRHGATRIYADIHAYPLWWLPLSLLLALAIQDTWFYWTHRLMHRPALFRRMHAVHHASRPPTAWAAMSFHPWEAITGAVVVPAVAFALPLHIGVIAAWLTIMTVMGTANHMGWEMFPRRLVHGRAGRWLITATHHQLHHDRYSCNYGLYFRFWDRLCGTDLGLASWDGHRARVDARRVERGAIGS